MEETNQFVIEEVKSPSIPRRLINETKSPSLQRRHLEHVIEVENKEIDRTWRSMCLVTDKNAVMFFIQVGIIFFVMCFTIFKLITDTPEGAQTTYMSLLTFCIGVIAPSPTFKKK